MEPNYIVGMIDDEIARLREVQHILHSLLPGEALIAPLLEAQQDEPESDLAETRVEPVAEEPTPVRHVSRRGISTGRRGPRRIKEPVAPRPLDAAIPQRPVVVARPVAVVAKPEPMPQPAEGTLEAWVRSLRPAAAIQVP